MSEADEQRIQESWLRRLRQMGAQAEPVAGGRSVRARLGLRPEPFAGQERGWETLWIATVGLRHVKCLEPTPLFQLPLVEVGACRSCTEIEDRIRAVWEEQRRELLALEERLDDLGVRAERAQRGAELAVPMEDGDATHRVRAAGRRQLALPSSGPLAGISLRRAADRVLAWDSAWESSTDYELAVVSRMTALARHAERQEDRRRQERARRGPQTEPPRRMKNLELPVPGAGPRVLLVGPRLAESAALRRSLTEHGLGVDVEKHAHGVEEAFARRSYELVLVDGDLGRTEGLELLPAIREIPGIEELPIVLVDDRSRAGRRDAARSLGAAGYLVHPVDSGRVAERLGVMAAGRNRRRFERFGERLAVEWAGAPAGYTTAVSRLGLFVCTERALAPGESEDCRLVLPGEPRSLEARIEAVYRSEAVAGQEGVAFRIRGFRGDDEPLWIRHLRSLAGRP